MRAVPFAFLSLMIAVPALADDNQWSTTVVSGAWLAGDGTDDYGHHACLALSTTEPIAVVFKSSAQEGLQVRLSNKAWSLPSDATGDTTFEVAGHQYKFTMKSGGGSLLFGNVDPKDLRPMLDDMDKSALLTVTVGNARASKISLSGSTKALNDFRTCSSVKGFADLGAVDIPGANPFGPATPKGSSNENGAM